MNVGFGNERGVVEHLLQEVNKLNELNKNSGLKKIVYSITQTAANGDGMSFELLENNSSLSLDGFSIFYTGVGEGNISFQSDSKVESLSFNGASASDKDVVFTTSLGSQTGNINATFRCYEIKDGLIMGLFKNTLLTIYINE